MTHRSAGVSRRRAAKQRVLARYPKAEYLLSFLKGFRIVVILGDGETEDKAWADAARRLKKGKPR